jgi:hypothetical protein
VNDFFVYFSSFSFVRLCFHLQLLFDMGFPDRAENLEALRVSNRDVATAIDFMMAKNLEDII